MAHIDDGKGGRSTNTDVNIVPFIDLMSVLIIFLLISAVWVQVSMIQIASSLYGKDPNQENQEKLQKENKKHLMLHLSILPLGYFLLVGEENLKIPKSNNQYDQKTLLKELKKIKTSHPKKNDALISLSEALPYGELITGMDALLVSNFEEISITTQIPEDPFQRTTN